MNSIISIKEYADYHISDNIESMENLQNQIISRMEGIEADLKRYKALARSGDFNGLDIFCGNASSALIHIMRDASRISTMRAENAVHGAWQEICENIQKGEQEA